MVIGWMDWDGGLTWPAPKNSCAVLTGGSRKTTSWPQSKRTYLYMPVLKSCWACGSGQESAHCCSIHCSELSHPALGCCSGTGWRARCPVPSGTSFKWSPTNGQLPGPDGALAQPSPGNRSTHHSTDVDVPAIVFCRRGKHVKKHIQYKCNIMNCRLLTVYFESCGKTEAFLYRRRIPKITKISCFWYPTLELSVKMKKVPNEVAGYAF